MRVAFDEAKRTLRDILITRDCSPQKAEKVAHEMARNALEGTYSHGINRFPRLIRNIDEGIVNVHVEPIRLHGFGGIENYDGQLGMGVTNAWFAMERCIALAKEHGIGLVAIRNTNHWMRAATYGLQACDAGLCALCFTNSMPNMPTWGALDNRLGNNPLVLAMPRRAGHLIVDMAMSQFSYGALEVARMEGRQMPVVAGYDSEGNLTRDPAAVLKTRRTIPAGYWKGAALSFLLDSFAGALSLGNTLAAASRLTGDEHGASQVMIAIDIQAIAPREEIEAILDDNVEFLLGSSPQDESTRIVYPGQKRLRIREENLAEGIPVDDGIWQAILSIPAPPVR